MNDLNNQNKNHIEHIFSEITKNGLYDDPSLCTDNVLAIYDKCLLFVEEQCKGRDKSHGTEHMVTVTSKALCIFNELQDTGEKLTHTDLINVVIGAMLHDVADHKYDIGGTLSERDKTFIKTLRSDGVYINIWTIINTLSFSKEKKAGGYKGLQQKYMIGFPVYIHRVRSIISDADRLEAIGRTGVERCIEYTMEMNPGVPLTQLQANVLEHAQEKLYRLPFPWPDMNGYSFFHTIPGIRMAAELHGDTEKYVKEYLELAE